MQQINKGNGGLMTQTQEVPIHRLLKASLMMMMKLISLKTRRKMTLIGMMMMKKKNLKIHQRRSRVSSRVNKWLLLWPAKRPNLLVCWVTILRTWCYRALTEAFHASEFLHNYKVPRWINTYK